MQLPITIGLHRSFLLAWGIGLGHGAAALVVLVTPWEAWVQGGLLVGLLASGVWSWRGWIPKVGKLRLLADGRIECELREGEGFLAAELLPGATVHPWLTAFRLRLPDKRVAVIVLPDSTIPEEFRRLRVWLRWRAEFIASTDGA